VRVRPPVGLALLLILGLSSIALAEDKPVQRFDVHEYRVLGNTVMSNRDIEGVLYPLLGDGKTIDDVDTARGALEKAYHDAGYATVFVDIPPQEINEGIVRLRVTEGKTRVRTISGARYSAEGKILDELPAVKPGTVPNMKELQTQLANVNAQTTDKSVTPVLKAGPVPGTMDVALKVDDHLPLHGGIDFNNQYSPDTEPLRATASLSYNNLFGELDSLSTQYTFTPQKTGQVSVVSANYGFRPVAGGLHPSVSFINSSSDVATVSGTGGALGVLGDGQVYGARLGIPLEYVPGNIQSLTLGLEYKHFRNTIGLTPVDDATGPTTTIQPISYLNASLGYQGSWQLASQLISFDFTANAGPRGWGNRTTNFETTRYLAHGNYFYLRSNLAFTQRLPLNMQLIVRGTLQESLEPLVVYEQASLSGADGVRGYLEAEILSDSAYKGSIQFQSPQWAPHGFILGDGFIFFDAGRGHRNDALSSESTADTLRSWGLGLDLLPGHFISGTLTIADPLNETTRTRKNEPRILFDLKSTF